MDIDLLGNTNIYKNTYAELVAWVRELHAMLRIQTNYHELNLKQAARIMELEFDLRKFKRIMKDNDQETVVKEYGIVDSNVVSNEELMAHRRKRGGGRGSSDDWLTDMEWGTIFYVRQKPVVPGSRSWLLTKFLMAGMRKNVVLLVPMHGAEEVISDDREWLPVEPRAFCKSFELVAELPPTPIESIDE